MRARKLGRHCERIHIQSCKRFASFLGRSPGTAIAAGVRAFQLSLIEVEGLTMRGAPPITSGKWASRLLEALALWSQ